MNADEKQTGSDRPDSVTPEADPNHIHTVTRQLEFSARELIGYVARLDRLERRMAAHAVKTSSRLVAVTRRADAVVDALAERERSLGQICTALGIAPVKGEQTAEEASQARITQTMNQIDVMAVSMLNMAEQLDSIFEAVAILQDDGGATDEMTDHLKKLRQGVAALDTVINLDKAG